MPISEWAVRAYGLRGLPTATNELDDTRSGMVMLVLLMTALGIDSQVNVWENAIYLSTYGSLLY